MGKKATRKRQKPNATPSIVGKLRGMFEKHNLNRKKVTPTGSGKTRILKPEEKAGPCDGYTQTALTEISPHIFGKSPKFTHMIVLARH